MSSLSEQMTQNVSTSPAWCSVYWTRSQVDKKNKIKYNNRKKKKKSSLYLLDHYLKFELTLR